MVARCRFLLVYIATGTVIAGATGRAEAKVGARHIGGVLVEVKLILMRAKALKWPPASSFSLERRFS